LTAKLRSLTTSACCGPLCGRHAQRSRSLIVKVYDARDEVIGAIEQFPHLQSGVREGAVRLSERSPGNAAGRANNSEIQRG
jgi:hypothetical protein